MANIIRIRSLDPEPNLNDVIIPVDKGVYGSNAKRISIYDLKSWILSGFTGGGGNTSCTGITSNIIRVIVTGTTTTTTTTLPVTTTTTTPNPAVSYIYFNPLANGALSVDNPSGRRFDLVFNYEIMARCDNYLNPGALNTTTTYFKFSTNGGSSWTDYDYIQADVDVGGHVLEQIKSGTLSISGVYNVTNIVMAGIVPCDPEYSFTGSVSGHVKVTIVSVTPNTGLADIICRDRWNNECLHNGAIYYEIRIYTDCSTILPTTTTTTAAPTLYGPFGVFWATNSSTLCGYGGGTIYYDLILYSYVNSSILVNGRTYYNSNGTTYSDPYDAYYSSYTPGVGNQYGTFNTNGVWTYTGTC